MRRAERCDFLLEAVKLWSTYGTRCLSACDL